MKMGVALSLMLLLSSASVFADTMLTGIIGDNKGESVLLLDEPQAFVSMPDGSGGSYILVAELKAEKEKYCNIKFTVGHTRNNMDPIELPHSFADLPWGVDKTFFFSTDGSPILIKLNATPSFLAALQGNEVATEAQIKLGKEIEAKNKK